MRFIAGLLMVINQFAAPAGRGKKDRAAVAAEVMAKNLEGPGGVPQSARHLLEARPATKKARKASYMRCLGKRGRRKKRQSAYVFGDPVDMIAVITYQIWGNKRNLTNILRYVPNQPTERVSVDFRPPSSEFSLGLSGQ